MDATEINRITSARALEDYTIELRFADGYIGHVDLKPQLWGTVFGQLADLTQFRQFRIEDDTIRWSNGADFCPDVLRYWCEAGRVTSQEETDRHFSEQFADRAAS